MELDRILVVAADDDADARELMEAVLRQHGASVVMTSSAEEALAAVKRVRPDVLVSDIAMPTTDGYGLIRSVRALPEDQGGRTPAVAVSAYGPALDRGLAFRSGFDRYVPKPIEIQHLIQVIHDLASSR